MEPGRHWTAQNGVRSIDLSGTSAVGPFAGSLSQTFATTSGDTYKVSFWLAGNPDGGPEPKTADVTVDLSSKQFTFDATGTTHNAMGWVLESFDFVADGPLQTITFASDLAKNDTNFGPALDNVDISRVPSPATLPLFETGQRQGDLLVLPWSAYDGTWIRLRQAKTGRKVNVPATRCLRAVLDNTPRTSPVILTNARGLSWHPNAFRKAWGAASRKAGLIDLTFHDLRGTAVTRPSEAECTPQEIATITGRSLRDVGAILDKYSARTDRLAIAAISKLERGGR